MAWHYLSCSVACPYLLQAYLSRAALWRSSSSQVSDDSMTLRGILTGWKQVELILLDHSSLCLASQQMETYQLIILAQPTMHPWVYKWSKSQTLKDRKVVVRIKLISAASFLSACCQFTLLWDIINVYTTYLALQIFGCIENRIICAGALTWKYTELWVVILWFQLIKSSCLNKINPEWETGNTRCFFTTKTKVFTYKKKGGKKKENN